MVFPSRPSPVAAALVALTLAALGFVAGYGYGFGLRSNLPQPAPAARPAAPEVKGLKASPDGKVAAFTGVYDGSRLAVRCLLDLQTMKCREFATPPGWQDYVTQWSADSRALLFERERIPRPVAEATAGLYRQNRDDSEPELLTGEINVPNEKITAGFWTPGQQLVIKTRREPKSLYVVENGVPKLVDQAPVNFQQHRATRENGKPVFYTVRDSPGQPGSAALFRVEGGKALKISEESSGAEWIYLEDNARGMIVCRQAGSDWEWTAYRVENGAARLLKTAIVPGDIIAVYWSPDGKRILGAGGHGLWLIDFPKLQAKPLAAESQWDSDDACWLGNSAVLVAAQGKLSKVLAADGTVQNLWKFPGQYWR